MWTCYTDQVGVLWEIQSKRGTFMKKENKKTHAEGEQTVFKKKKKKDDSQLLACQTELEQWKEKYMRVSADLENFRRRMEKERARWMESAQAEVVYDMLSIVDNFETVLNQTKKQELSTEQKKWFDGFAMINKMFSKSLKTHGLQEITEIEQFDPELHEAISQVESEDHESGEIVEVLQKGYRFKDEVLRPAKVSVAK